MGLTAKSQRLLLLFLIITSLALVALIVSDWLPYLRGPAPETNEWYWPHSLRPYVRWWPAMLVTVLLWIVAAWWLSPNQSNRSRDIMAISALFAASLLLQITVIYADRPELAAELVDRTLSNQASGFFEPAAEIDDIGSVLRNYPQQMPQFASEHAQTHPPGLIVANWLSIQALSQWPEFSERIAQFVRPLRCTDLWLLNRPAQVSAALAIWSLLPLLAAAACIIPAYGLARVLLHGRSRRLSAVLVAAIPSLLLFAPKSVQLYALLVLFLFWSFQSALVNHSLWRFLLAGIILSLMTFLSLGNAVLLPLLILYAALQHWQATDYHRQGPEIQLDWVSFSKQMLAFGLGTACFWLLNWLLWKVPPWTIVQVGLQQHYNLVTRFRRFDWWVIWNLIDLALFSGWPLFLGFIGSTIFALRAWRRKRIIAVDIMAICLVLLIFILDISGSSRGEVGRIWLFFIPLLAFPAARFWTSMLPDKRHAWTIIALQLLVAISIGLSWRPVRAVIVVAQEPDVTPQSMTTGLSVSFDEEPFVLAGYALPSDHAVAGEQIELTLFWKTNGPTQSPYTVFNHVLNRSGALVAQQDNWSLNGRWPPTCWQTGAEIIDTYHIALPEDLPAGTYELYSGLYDARSGLRVPLQNGEDAVFISEITVSSK